MVETDGPLSTAVTRMLGIRHPILLAPMGGIAGGDLAAAVSDAGGLGFVGVGYLDARGLKHQIVAARASRVGYGFITWLLAKSPGLLELALDQRPPAVLLTFGDIGQFAERIRAAGPRLICQVSSLRDADVALDQGVDVLVAQGSEGGGHGTHDRSTLTLLPEIVDLVDRRGLRAPVLAAGGIADGRGLAAALSLGATGVVVGSRFSTCPESLASPGARARIVRATGDDTVTTRIYDRVRGITWPEGFTSRVLRSSFLAEWVGHEALLDRELDRVARRYESAVRQGDVDTALVTVGEAAGLIRDAEPAAAIVDRMVAEAIERITFTVGLVSRVSVSRFPS